MTVCQDYINVNLMYTLYIFLLGYEGGNSYPDIGLTHFDSILVRGLWLLLCWAGMWLFKWVSPVGLSSQSIVSVLCQTFTYVSVFKRYLVKSM